MILAADAGALVATVLGVVGALVQLRRLARTGDRAGVSAAAVAVGVSYELAWVAYSSHAELWTAVPVSVAMVVIHAVTAALLAIRGSAVARPVGLAVLWATGLAAATGLGGWTLLGVLLPLVYLARLAPAVWTAWRSMVPSGLALTTWLSVLVESALWTAYGLAYRDPAIAQYGAIGSVAAAAIVVRLALVADRVQLAKGLTEPERLVNLEVIGRQLHLEAAYRRSGDSGRGRPRPPDRGRIRTAAHRRDGRPGPSASPPGPEYSPGRS